MIEEHAVILALDSHPNTPASTATLEVVRTKACSLCGQTSGCGNQMWGKMFAHKSTDFKAKNTIDAKVGDKVIVGIDEQAFMRSAIFLYIIPLVTMLIVTIFVSQITDSDGAAIIAAVVGLAIGFIWIKGHVSGGNYFQDHQPTILRLDNT